MAEARAWNAPEEHTAAQNTHPFADFDAFVRRQHFSDVVVLNLLRACRIPERVTDNRPRKHFSIGRMLRLTTDLQQKRAVFAGVDGRIIHCMQQFVCRELETCPPPAVFEPPRELLDTVFWDDGRTSRVVTLGSWCRFAAERHNNAAKATALKQDFRKILQYGAWGAQGGAQNIAIAAPGLAYDSRWALSAQAFAETSAHVVMYSTSLSNLSTTTITETGMYGAAVRSHLYAEGPMDRIE